MSLWLLAVFGGCFGAVLGKLLPQSLLKLTKSVLNSTTGMFAFRHKTNQWQFVVINVVSLIVWVAALMYLTPIQLMNANQGLTW